MTGDPRRYAPAAARNRGPILDALRVLLPATGLLLELASGSGEHALAIASAFPALTVQPSDPDPDARASIDAWGGGTLNLRPALALDAARRPWPIAAADAVLCVNMLHVAPWAATLGLLAGAAAVLPAGAPLLIYGPFHRDGRPTGPGNAAFDAALRAEDPGWGVRDVAAVAAAATGFDPPATVAMPADNLILVLRRRAGPPGGTSAG